MAQFDVYENRNPVTKKKFPYLLDVQTDLLDAGQAAFLGAVERLPGRVGVIQALGGL